MKRMLTFLNRNIKEMSRDPLVYVFCLGFPLVMLILFSVINQYTGDNTPMFDSLALIPGVMMFSFTFVMLHMSLLVSKDKSSVLLKRLYTSPMKPHEFVLGYAIIGIIIGLVQALCTIIFGFFISLISCTFGYNASGGAKGVGIATTRAVVWSFVAIVILDMIYAMCFFF